MLFSLYVVYFCVFQKSAFYFQVTHSFTPSHTQICVLHVQRLAHFTQGYTVIVNYDVHTPSTSHHQVLIYTDHHQVVTNGLAANIALSGLQLKITKTTSACSRTELTTFQIEWACTTCIYTYYTMYMWAQSNSSNHVSVWLCTCSANYTQRVRFPMKYNISLAGGQNRIYK